MPVETLPDATAGTYDVPFRLRAAAVVLRSIFVGALLVITVRVSTPQSETIWSIFETRLARPYPGGSGYCRVDLDSGSPFHTSEGCRGLPDLGLSRSGVGSARIGMRCCRLVTRFMLASATGRNALRASKRLCGICFMAR